MSSGGWVQIGGTTISDYTAQSQSNLGSISARGSSSYEFNALNFGASQAGIWGFVASVSVRYGGVPMYTSAAEWTSTVNAASRFGNKLAAVGIGFTLYNIYLNNWKVSTSDKLDLVFGGVGLLPGGQIPSGIYFTANLITIGATGQTIGQHIDNYYWIPTVGLNFVAVPKK